MNVVQEESSIPLEKTSKGIHYEKIFDSYFCDGWNDGNMDSFYGI